MKCHICGTDNAVSECKHYTSEPEGLILRTVIDIAFADLVTSYKDRQQAIDAIFARIEQQGIGDWITEDTGRKYELTYIPKGRG